MRFTRRLQSTLLAFALVPFTLAIIVSMVTFSANFSPLVIKNIAFEADLYANKITTYIGEQFMHLQGIRDQQAFQQLLGYLQYGEGEDLPNETVADIHEILLYHMSLHQDTQAIYIEDADRNIIVQSDPLFPARSSLFLDLSDSVTENHGMIVSPVITSPAESSQDVYIIIGLPIYAETGHCATLISVLELSSLRSFAQEDYLFDSSFRLVFDENGTIVAVSEREHNNWAITDFDNRSDLGKQFSRIDVTEQPVGILEFSFDGADSIGHYQYIPELGWTVFSSIQTREIHQPLMDILPTYIITILVILGVLLVALHWISRQVGSPIQALIDGMKEARKQNYDHQIVIDGASEFRDVANAFNVLSEQVRLDTRALRRLNEELDTLTTHIPGGLFTCTLDPGMPFQFVSDPFVRLTGFPNKRALLEVSDNTFLQTVHPEDRFRVEQAIRWQEDPNSEGTIEYRTLGETGTRWLSCSFRLHQETDSESALLLYGMAVDATAKHEASVALRASDQRYRTLLEQTDEVIFEWSIPEKKFLFTSREKNLIRMFGAPLPKDGNLFSGDFYQMYPEDRTRFVSQLKSVVREGKRSIRLEVRLTRWESGETYYFWTRFLLTSLFDNNGKVERLAGRIMDIHEEKVESLRLIGLSQTDPLTSLMNRRGFQASIERILEYADPESNVHRLIMLDIDDFKQINDTHGHVYGDTILTLVAKQLRGVFRATDLFARIGGDEFSVCLVNFPDRSVLKSKIETLKERMHAENLSCSIGIATYPSDGDTYIDLYRKADHALYTVKQNGKDGYAFSTGE